ncbi:Zinc-type alcohol dehydrogenase-like protein [Cyphellophora attinorum]|uniref:Zinc-type alcohol dehydrogenase-like protein n=1 Tax=Cyphellophora attinorum TaxID=1664694 RepID=A0A0N0NM25_9EURO|nr:Zinc-type alcohol dehydrogenase-like protein [Phialophora attinorum]KPI39971.1 Zinc-type alcohol dehydrogenase-like protein [Phialophora attinorum]
MALPSTQKQWILCGTEKGLDEWQFRDAAVPQVGSHGVLVKMHAAGLNYREVLIPAGGFPYQLNLPVVGGSDGAGEVLEVGAGVTKWRKGDRGDAYRMGALGAALDGTFQQYAVFDEDWLVRLASNLSYLEGAVLSNAAVTAWNALYGGRSLRPGEWVLVQGTGGVSMFALQFAKSGGAKVVATTSSDAKADILRRYGADHVINYRTTPDWGAAAKQLTGRNEGFDNILEIGGAGTLEQSISAIRKEGTITVIGVVTGLVAPVNPLETVYKIFTLRGIHVGSKVQFEEMMAAIEANAIQPVIDGTHFALEDLREALEYLKEQKHVGKVAIKIV